MWRLTIRGLRGTIRLMFHCGEPWTTILFYGPVILLATGIILNSVTLMALGTLFALLYCLAFLVLIW